MSQATGIDTRVAKDQAGTRSGARWRSRVLRPMLMLGGVVLLLIAAACWWLQSGRIVSIDDATVQAAQLSVSTDVSGIVSVVAVHEGQRVHRGEILFRLNQRPFRIALDGADAARGQVVLNVAAMKRDYQRQQHEVQAREALVRADQEDFKRFAGLVGTGAATRAETDDARFKLAADQQSVNALQAQGDVQLARLGGSADIEATQTPAYQQAQARVDEAERELEHTVVRAPFDGIVTQVDTLQPGMYLAAATPAFALVSTERVWAEGDPKETELTWVRPGDEVRVHVDTYPGQVWHGSVQSIAPASGSEFSVLPAQNTSGNWVKVVQRIPLRVSIARRAGAGDLRAGMSVELDIDTGHVRHLSDLIP